MEIKNRKSLVDFVKSTGYTGAASLADIKAYWDDEANGIEVKDKSGNVVKSADLDKIWSVTFGATTQEDEPKSKSKGRFTAVTAEIGTGSDDNETSFGVNPKAWRKAAERKNYNRKAANGRMKGVGTAFPDADVAEQFGAWFRTNVLPDRMDYEGKAEDRDICQKANITTTNTAGGATVPQDFDPMMIDLKEQYGLARQLLGTTPMANDTLTMPRRTGGTTVYAPGEATAITESNPTVDSVQLTAVKMACYTECSSELLNDSAINFADFIAREMAYAFSVKEDDCWLTGDGTSTDFNIQGLTTKFLGLTATRANIAGEFIGSSSTLSSVTVGDLVSTMALAPNYIDNAPGVGWICHKRIYHNVMRRLILAQGGSTAMEMVNGVPRYIFEGYPVYTTPHMTRVGGAIDLQLAFFGAPKLSSSFGEVRGGTSIATSTDFKFTSDIVSFRAIQRVAINNHDIGNQSATEASRVPGPIVGLLTP